MPSTTDGTGGTPEFHGRMDLTLNPLPIPGFLISCSFDPCGEVNGRDVAPFEGYPTEHMVCASPALQTPY